jgi:tripartite-type tricarboxylate transporter receptor subunit TctC
MYPVRRGFFTTVPRQCAAVVVLDSIFPVGIASRALRALTRRCIGIQPVAKSRSTTTVVNIVISSLRVAVTATFTAVVSGVAAAQGYPVKPLRIVVPFQSGGSVEPIARLVGQKLTSAFGRSVVIDNRPGAGGMVGTEYVAKSPADGYTLLAIPAAFVMNAALYENVSYDPVRDFEAVATLASYPLLVACHPSLPVHSVKALIALAKAEPGKLDYSSGGLGTGNHVAAELFGHLAGVRLIHVPYVQRRRSCFHGTDRR